MFDPASVRFRGPLTSYVEGFWEELLRHGYAPLSARNLLYVAAHFSRWLEGRSLEPGEVTDALVAAFLAHRRRRGYTHFLSPRALGPLVRYLRDLEVVPTPRPTVASSSIDRFVGDYAQYLAGERGLTASTIRRYTDFAREFVAVRRDGPQCERLRPADITGFVLREARRCSIGHCKHQVCALRSMLRYLYATGRIRRDLTGCVPAIAGWRLAWLPKALEPEQVQRVLRSTDARSPVGRRDAAIVRLLLRLGLRAGDVATLTLDDLDWRAGVLSLRGKGRRESRLPLPQDVGRALASYLRDGRPPTSSRRVFLRSRAPHGALGSGGVIAAVRQVLRRAGVDRGGSHLLRHTAATQMLRHGASLPEIGHVLRHRHVDTTAIYAKVDLASLRTLAQRWPGGAA